MSEKNNVRMVFATLLTTRQFQLVVYIVWPGESESAVQNNQILQQKDEIRKNIFYNKFGKNSYEPY